MNKFQTVIGAAIAAAALLGMVGSASAASKGLVVVNIDGPKHQHITVHKGQTIWLAVDKESVNGVEVQVKSRHHVLRPLKSNVFHFSDKKMASVGFSKNLEAEGDVYLAARPGTAKITAVVTRPSLGGIRAHWEKVITVTVTK